MSLSAMLNYYSFSAAAAAASISLHLLRITTHGVMFDFEEEKDLRDLCLKAFNI